MRPAPQAGIFYLRREEYVPALTIVAISSNQAMVLECERIGWRMVDMKKKKMCERGGAMF
jgi:hypothetical protein